MNYRSTAVKDHLSRLWFLLTRWSKQNFDGHEGTFLRIFFRFYLDFFSPVVLISFLPLIYFKLSLAVLCLILVCVFTNFLYMTLQNFAMFTFARGSRETELRQIFFLNSQLEFSWAKLRMMKRKFLPVFLQKIGLKILTR